MSKQITTLFVSGPEGVSRMLSQGQFEQIDKTHVKFETTRDITLKNITLVSGYPFGRPMKFESFDVRVIESVTATIVDVYGTLETRRVEERILDLEFKGLREIDLEIDLIDQSFKEILIDRLNEPERLEKLVGNIVVVAS